MKRTYTAPWEDPAYKYEPPKAPWERVGLVEDSETASMWFRKEELGRLKQILTQGGAMVAFWRVQWPKFGAVVKVAETFSGERYAPEALILRRAVCVDDWALFLAGYPKSHPETLSYLEVVYGGMCGLRLASNPNASWELLQKLSKKFPHEVQQNPAYALYLLEDPSRAPQPKEKKT